MSGKPYNLNETNWNTVKNCEYELAILPWGATEAHNYHLPYGTDTIECEFISAESARIAWEKGAKVIVLPIVPYGVNTGQIDIKLTINMNPSTQMMIVEDVVESLSRQGIRKLLILNGHGGNDFKPIIREISTKYPDIFVALLNWYNILDNTKYFDDPGDHAGEMETSNMLHINDELVLPPNQAGTGEYRNFKINGLKEGWVWAQRDWQKVSEDTGIGNPELATAEKGKIYLETVINKIADFLVEFAECNVDDMYE